MSDLGGEPWTMVQKRGNQSVVNDKPFYVNEFNTYWLMVFVVNQSTKEKVNEVFQQAVSVDLVVCWTWVFNGDHWRAFRKSLSIYVEEVLKARDFVLSEARKYEIGFILSLSNNWGEYGGKAQTTTGSHWSRYC